MYRFILLIAILCAGMAGCTPMNVQGDQAPDDRVFTTGSHLPSKANSNSVTVYQPPPPDQAARSTPCVGGSCGASK